MPLQLPGCRMLPHPAVLDRCDDGYCTAYVLAGVLSLSLPFSSVVCPTNHRHYLLPLSPPVAIPPSPSETCMASISILQSLQHLSFCSFARYRRLGSNNQCFFL
jgi:hypothetical protein